jgi:hypothetical protein
VIVFWRLLWIASVALLAAPGALGQARLTGADLAGIVTDQTGALIVGCAVTVTNADTNVSRTVLTGERGEYRAPALPPGSYTISAAANGFKTQTRDRVELALGQAMNVDFSLVVGVASEAVSVDATAPAISPSRTEISTVVTQQQIEHLPINLRSFIGSALVTPGVAPDRTPLRGAAATSGLSFTGQRGRSNNIMVDGLDNNDPVLGSVRATFSQEAVREFHSWSTRTPPNSAKPLAVSSTSSPEAAPTPYAAMRSSTSATRRSTPGSTSTSPICSAIRSRSTNHRSRSGSGAVRSGARSVRTGRFTFCRSSAGRSPIPGS